MCLFSPARRMAAGSTGSARFGSRLSTCAPSTNKLLDQPFQVIRPANKPGGRGHERLYVPFKYVSKN